MAFSATKRELGELYTFFRLLADGAVSPGTPKAEKDETLRSACCLDTEGRA